MERYTRSGARTQVPEAEPARRASEAAMVDRSARGEQLRALAHLAHGGPAAVAQRRTLQTMFGAAAQFRGDPGRIAQQQPLQPIRSAGAAPAQLMVIYRGMQASTPGAGSPLVGDLGWALGARDEDVVHSRDPDNTANVRTGLGGMSTANAEADTFPTTVSKSYPNMTHNNTNQGAQAFRWKWSVDTATFPDTLTPHPDGGSHVSVEPSRTMPLTDYRAALHGTQANWVKIPPP